MTYMPCTKGIIKTIIRLNGNKISGKIEINGKLYYYETRNDLGRAINKVYINKLWTPKINTEVIVDAVYYNNITHIYENSNKDVLIIDHIEKWEPKKYVTLLKYQDIQERLIKNIKKIYYRDKLLKYSVHDDDGTEVIIMRWKYPALIKNQIIITPVIVNAIIADDEIRFKFSTKNAGLDVHQGNIDIAEHLIYGAKIPKLIFDDDIDNKEKYKVRIDEKNYKTKKDIKNDPR